MAGQHRGWGNVDRDGRLAHHDRRRGEVHIGDATPAMVARVMATTVDLLPYGHAPGSIPGLICRTCGTSFRGHGDASRCITCAAVLADEERERADGGRPAGGPAARRR